MGTPGRISFVASNIAKDSYSHYDSGPDDLGIRMLSWLRSAIARPDELRAAIIRLQVVDIDYPIPTPDEVSRLRQYSDPSVGDPTSDWYALLHGTQGDPEAIFAAGYITSMDDDYAWLYEVNVDERSFTVNYSIEGSVTWPWSALPTDDQFRAQANQLEEDTADDDDY